MKKIVLFRISSKGYPKVKVDGISKFDSLNNLQASFPGWEFICVADNCDQPLLDRLHSDYRFDQIVETQLGNPGSFWKLYEMALESTQDDDVVYFIEDDYMHLPGSPEAILEGLQYFDYVTLYDHPDKYALSTCAINPYTKRNRFSESTEVVLGERQVWRTSNSTTMTFAVTGKTLREDSDIWSMTKTAQRDFDFDIFCVLTKQGTLPKSRFLKQLPLKWKFASKARRYLGIPIPGLAMHLEAAYLNARERKRFNLPPA